MATTDSMTELDSNAECDFVGNCETKEKFTADAEKATPNTSTNSDDSKSMNNGSVPSDNIAAKAFNVDTLEFALARVEALEEKLRLSRLEILEKDQKCNSLIKLQTKVDCEVEELTSALFQEAYRMVNSAEERSQNAERLLSEARLKVDVLESEVLGLKQIVKETSKTSVRRPSSTPTNIGNSAKTSILRFLNNSLSAKSAELNYASNQSPARRSIFSPATVTPTLSKSTSAYHNLSNGSALNLRPFSRSEGNEIDPIYYREFMMWRENSSGLDENCAFLRRIIHEDVEPCLVFENKELSKRVLLAIKENRLEMEPYAPSSNKNTNTVFNNFRECALLAIRRLCPYRLRLASDAEWQFISLLARNRIAAVCDFFTYIRYLTQGIIKPSTNDSYWCIINLRKNMSLAKLGLHFVLRMNGASSSPDSLVSSPQMSLPGSTACNGVGIASE